MLLPSVKALRSVPGASRSGFTRPSRVGPLEEKDARLSKAFASGGASEKETVSFPPACAPCSEHYTHVRPLDPVEMYQCARASRSHE